MATKLKNLKVTKVDFVDDGANPDAHIRLYKSKDGTPEPPQEAETGESPNFWKRLFTSIAKAFSANSEDFESALEEIEKSGAESFGEKLNEEKNRKIADEIWDICYALQSSLCSILNDEELDGVSAGNAMKESLSEFDSVIIGAIEQWSNGKAASIVAKDNEVTATELEMMKSVRARLDETIEKAVVVADGPTETISSEPKGESEMKIDKSKMTPAERAFFEEIEKRYGTDEGGEAQAGENTAAEAPQSTEAPATEAPAVEKKNTQSEAPKQEQTEDVYKNIDPAIKAELESLKKFHEDTEDKALHEVAKRYAIIGKTDEELFPVLKSLKAAGGTSYDDMIAVLDSAVETVEKSGAFTEIGKSGGQQTDGAAWAKADAKAAEIMKSNNGVTKAQALDMVFQSDPELAAECEKED